MFLNILSNYVDVGVESRSSPTDGINGFLASSDDEWFHKLSILIDDETLRKKMEIMEGLG